jgi:hypothetical protein
MPVCNDDRAAIPMSNGAIAPMGMATPYPANKPDSSAPLSIGSAAPVRMSGRAAVDAGRSPGEIGVSTAIRSTSWPDDAGRSARAATHFRPANALRPHLAGVSGDGGEGAPPSTGGLSREEARSPSFNAGRHFSIGWPICFPTMTSGTRPNAHGGNNETTG